MSIRNVGTYYLIEGLLDHKEKRDVGGVEFHIAKNFENNLRERNPILGIVHDVSKHNPLKLKKGDNVIVSHWSFYGDIGKDKSYQSQEFVEVDGKKLFRVHQNDIFFTYNNDEIKPVGTILGVEKVEDTIEQFGIVSTILHNDRGRVIYPNCGVEKGTEVLLEKHALYEIEFNKKKFYRIRENEIVGIIHEEAIPKELNWRKVTDESYDGSGYNPLLEEMLQKTAKVTGKKTVEPYNGRIVVQDLYEPSEDSKKYPDIFPAPRDYNAKVLAVGALTDKEKHEFGNIKAGDTVFRARKSGIPFGDLAVCSMTDDTVHLIYGR